MPNDEIVKFQFAISRSDKYLGMLSTSLRSKFRTCLSNPAPSLRSQLWVSNREACWICSAIPELSDGRLPRSAARGLEFGCPISFLTLGICTTLNPPQSMSASSICLPSTFPPHIPAFSAWLFSNSLYFHRRYTVSIGPMLTRAHPSPKDTQQRLLFT